MLGCGQVKRGGVLLLLVFTTWLTHVQAVVEEIEVDPTNTNGFELGELSFLQFVLGCLIFIQIVVLYSEGVLPIEVDLSFRNTDAGFIRRRRPSPHTTVSNINTDAGFIRRRRPSPHTTVSNINTDAGFIRRRRSRPHTTMATPTFLMDCPLQYVCEVDAWANRDHDFFLESLLASWFRNSNHTWTHPEAATFAGAGTCREMYPCPFDVQDVVGIRIPGSTALASTQDETYSTFFTETIGLRQDPWL